MSDEVVERGKYVSLTYSITSQAGDFFRYAFNADRLAQFRQVEDTDPTAVAELVGGLDIVGFADPASFLAAPQLWLGLTVTAVFVSGAIYLRRYRDSS